MSRRAFHRNAVEDDLIGEIDFKARKAAEPSARPSCPHVEQFDQAAANLLEQRGRAVVFHRASGLVQQLCGVRTDRPAKANRTEAEAVFAPTPNGGER